MPYSLDTSGILDAWTRYYPADVFPSIWTHMDAAAQNGTIFAIDEVLRELERKEDGIHQWLKQRPSVVVPIDGEIQTCVTEIMARYDRLVDNRRHRSGCDPWVIALARVRGYTVVTGERPSGRIEKPKIPDVCRDLGIRCFQVVDFFRDQGWRV